MSLTQPGPVGVGIRIVMFLLVTWLGYTAFVQRDRFVAGFTWDMLWMLVPVAMYTNAVFGELTLQRSKLPALLLGAGWGALYLLGLSMDQLSAAGVWSWLWIMLVAIVLAPAFLLAALLRTPGCEMRSYQHLRITLSGGEGETTVCPGWIDKFDNFGKKS